MLLLALPSVVAELNAILKSGASVDFTFLDSKKGNPIAFLQENLTSTNVSVGFTLADTKVFHKDYKVKILTGNGSPMYWLSPNSGETVTLTHDINVK